MHIALNQNQVNKFSLMLVIIAIRNAGFRLLILEKFYQSTNYS